MESEAIVALGICAALLSLIIYIIVKSRWVRSVIGKVITTVVVAAIAAPVGALVDVPMEASSITASLVTIGVFVVSASEA